MIKVYGSSDDLVEIDGDITKEFGHYSDDETAYLSFSDGTLLEVRYDGIWRLTILKSGWAKPNKTFTAMDADADQFSDIVELEDKVEWVVFGKSIAHATKDSRITK